MNLMKTISLIRRVAEEQSITLDEAIAAIEEKGLKRRSRRKPPESLSEQLDKIAARGAR
jgi:hypothetical protein